MDKAAPDPLQAIRSRIDAIDESMHRLLIERSGVVAELIRIKGTSKPGAAFRPDREADMMRRMALRHEGDLPLFTVEHIWREIITTFTAMQAPFAIAAGPAADTLAMRDAIRFYFGFSVAIEDHATNEAAVARVVETASDIAVVTADAGGRWWSSLEGSDAPKVFAKLPFMEIPARPAELPAYVIGPRLGETPAPDIRLLGMAKADGLMEAIAAFGGLVVANAGDDILIELPVTIPLDEMADTIGTLVRGATDIGGFSQPIRFLAERVA